ncbi:MAG TPA: hypothetical protein VNM24_05040 [Burkholderiales bacterium]|nr:hypothetical protein [Burkholderiales bacterium]
MPSPLIARLALLATALVFAILASSAYLRLSAAAGDCAFRPECATRSVPSLARTIARAAHRLSASVVAVVVLLIAALGWLRREAGQETRWLALALIVLTAFLAVLGAAARDSYAPAVTLGNVIAGNAMAAIGWWLYLRNRSASPAPRHGRALLAGCAVTAFAISLALAAPAASGAVASLSMGMTLSIAATLTLLASVWFFARLASAPR